MSDDATPGPGEPNIIIPVELFRGVEANLNLLLSQALDAATMLEGSGFANQIRTTCDKMAYVFGKAEGKSGPFRRHWSKPEPTDKPEDWDKPFGLPTS